MEPETLIWLLRGLRATAEISRLCAVLNSSAKSIVVGGGVGLWGDSRAPSSESGYMRRPETRG